jgi:hypothetical protein
VHSGDHQHQLSVARHTGSLARREPRPKPFRALGKAPRYHRRESWPRLLQQPS